MKKERFVVDPEGSTRPETKVEASVSNELRFYLNQLEKTEDPKDQELLKRLIATSQESQKLIDGMTEEEQIEWDERIKKRGEELVKKAEKRLEELKSI